MHRTEGATVIVFVLLVTGAVVFPVGLAYLILGLCWEREERA